MKNKIFNTLKNNRFVLLSPIFTLTIMLIVYYLNGVYPFGSMTINSGDTINQFIPLLSELTSKLKEGGSLFFTWHAGRGVNFWSNIAYYLASPFNLIALFFNENTMGNAYATIVLVKLVFAPIPFGIYLKERYKNNDLSITVFSVLWSVSAFLILSLHYFMWLDAIILLPLIALGLHHLVEGRGVTLYATTLGLAIASNFYIGWMLCLFSIIYFVYCMFINPNFTIDNTKTPTTEKVNIVDLFTKSFLLGNALKFGLSSLIAGGLSAIFTLPTVYSLNATGKGVGKLETINPTELWGILSSLVLPTDTNPAATTTDHIFVFAGTITIILAFAYIFSKPYFSREKIGDLFLVSLFVLSVVFSGISSVWHGFSIPAGIMYRFAFIFSFVLLKLAYQAHINIKQIPTHSIVIGCAAATFCLCSSFFSYTAKAGTSPSTQIIVMSLIVIQTAILLIVKTKPSVKKITTYVLLILVVFESIFVNFTKIGTFDFLKMLENGKVVQETTNKTNDYEQIAFVSKNIDTQYSMNGLLFGYNDMYYYSSLADYTFMGTVRCLGSFSNNINSQLGAVNNNPIFNIVFPVRYYLDGSESLSETWFRTSIQESYDGYVFYENNYTMPFMYVVDDMINTWDSHGFPVTVDNQNDLFKCYTDTEENVISYNLVQNFSYVNCKQQGYLGDTTENVDAGNSMATYFEFLNSKMSAFYYEVEDLTKPASIMFESIAQDDGIMYLHIDGGQFGNLDITTNNKHIHSDLSNTLNNGRTYEVGEVKKGDVITVEFSGFRFNEFAYNNNTGKIKAVNYTVKKDVFETGYEKLDSMSDTEVLAFTDTSVKAKVTSHTDGMLYIPITYDEGWSITIDGVPVELYKHNSHILMTEFTEGTHIVEMNYVPQGFSEGLLITSVSFLALAGLCIIKVLKKCRKDI